MARRAVDGAGATGRRQRGEYETEFGRFGAFSDGVFAIAITLLVLNLDTAGIFIASIPIALLSPLAAQLMWAASLLMIHRQRRLAAR